jgi:hypothetical protein
MRALDDAVRARRSSTSGSPTLRPGWCRVPTHWPNGAAGPPSTLRAARIGWTARERAPVDCVLPDDAVKRLEAATDFTAGFPTDFIATSLGIRRGVRAR